METDQPLVRTVQCSACAIRPENGSI